MLNKLKTTTFDLKSKTEEIVKTEFHSSIVESTVKMANIHNNVKEHTKGSVLNSINYVQNENQGSFKSFLNIFKQQEEISQRSINEIKKLVCFQ